MVAGLGVICVPPGMLRPPMSASQSRHRRELKEELLERDTHCRGCGKPLVQPLIHMHEGLISKADVQGWPRKLRGQINVELNCVLLCPECNLGNATHHAPSRERIFSEHLEIYGENVLHWLRSLGFKSGAHPLKGLLEGSAMNNKERKVIYEFKQLLNRVPAGHTGLGTKSVSIAGIAGAHQDFIEARRATGLFLVALMNASTPFEEEAPEEVLRAFEAWFADRAADKWKPRLTDFFSYYLDYTRVNRA